MKSKHWSIPVACLALVSVCSTPLSAGWTVEYLRGVGAGDRSKAYGVSEGRLVGATFYGPGGPLEPDTRAILWSGPAHDPTDLRPTEYMVAGAYDISGDTQVGLVSKNGTTNSHASLWIGSASTLVDLHPSGWYLSLAQGVSGDEQVGRVGNSAGDARQAALWRGTAASFVNLNPAGSSTSEARRVSDRQIVGWASGAATGGNSHASLWTGTAESWIDLNPAGASSSDLYDTTGTQHVGWARGSLTGGQYHAGLWTATGWVDLHPAGWNITAATGISGGVQVGFGYASGSSTYHAIIWNGSAQSYFDLNTPFGPDYRGGSYASDVEVIGDEIWVVGWSESLDAHTGAVLWHYIVPEPSGLAFLSLSLAPLAIAAARKRRT